MTTNTYRKYDTTINTCHTIYRIRRPFRGIHIIQRPFRTIYKIQRSIGKSKKISNLVLHNNITIQMSQQIYVGFISLQTYYIVLIGF